jgi:ABC-type transporter Mla MlaB component
MTAAASKSGNTIALSGVITLTNVTDLCRNVIRDMEEGVIVDLAGLTAVSSACVSLLVELKRYAKDNSFVLSFINPSDDLMSMVNIVNVAEVLQIRA